MSKLKVAIGAAVGAVVGFTAGILTAPKSGKQTRDDIKHAAAIAKDTVVDEAGKAKLKAEAVVSDVKAKAGEVTEDVTSKANELKGRTEQALAGAKKGFAKKPQTKKK